MSKRKVLSLEEKVSIISDSERGVSQADVGRKYGLSKSTVCNVLKNKDKILSALSKNKPGTKKLRTADRVDVDEALLKWFTFQRSSGIAINGPVLKIKAEQLAKLLDENQEFVCSEGWLDRWKKRHNITVGKISGEAKSVDQEMASEWSSSEWPEICSGYSADDIFNGDETGLFYQLTPDTTLKFKGETCVGGKMSKNRVTLWLCANMSGSEKRQLLLIGKFKNPRCFKNVKKLPVNYQSNSKAWMTSSIFEEELRRWDRELRVKERKILLLVDNCPAHPHVENLSNIKLVFLPANTTAVLQPMDQGVIRSFKTYYRREVTLHLIQALESQQNIPISVLSAVRFANKAWRSVTTSTIQNCFRRAGLATGCVAFEEEDDVPLAELLEHVSDNAVKIQDFIDADCKVTTSEIPSDEAIVEATKRRTSPGDESEDDDVSEEAVPTVKEALQGVKTALRFLETMSNVESSIEKAQILEKDLEKLFVKSVYRKQPPITDYFAVH